MLAKLRERLFKQVGDATYRKDGNVNAAETLVREQIVDEVRVQFQGQPMSTVVAELSRRFATAGVEADQAEVDQLASSISTRAT